MALYVSQIVSNDRSISCSQQRPQQKNVCWSVLPRRTDVTAASRALEETNSSSARTRWSTLGELEFTFPSGPINFSTEEDNHENSRLRRSAVCIFRGRNGPAVSRERFHKTFGREHRERRKSGSWHGHAVSRRVRRKDCSGHQKPSPVRALHSHPPAGKARSPGFHIH